MRTRRKLKITAIAVLALLCAVAGVGYCTTVLTDGTTWCTGVKSPDPGDPVRASSGTIGTIRDGLQCLANRTNGLMKGTVSHKAVYADGTGGISVTVPAGDVEAFQDIISQNGNLAAQNGNVYAQTSVMGQGADTTTVSGHGIAWTGTTNGGGGSNPPSTTALAKNDFRAVLAPRVWATILCDGIGGCAIQDGANLNGVSIPAMGNQIDVVFGTSMDNALYLVLVTAWISAVPYPVTTIKATNKVTLDFGATDPRSHAFHIDVLVLGRQTS